MNVSRRWSFSSRSVISIRTAIDDCSPCDSKVLTAKSTGKVVPSRRRASPLPTSLVPPPCARAEQVVERPPADLRRRVAETAQRLPVGVAHPSVRLDHEEDPRVRLERGAEPRLAFELRPGVFKLVTGVLELTLEDALLADRLAAFGRARGLPGEQGEQDTIVIEEQRPGIGVDDQPSLASQVGFDRKRDRRVAGRILAVTRRGTVIRVPDLQSASAASRRRSGPPAASRAR